MVYRPGFVTKALERITQPDQAYFFWSGTSLPVTAAHCWRSRLHLVDRCAGVKDFRPRRLRDTFAVEALLAGVSMQNVSALPGHGSVSTTEQYYAAWKVARRDRLALIVREAYECDLSVLSFDRFIHDNNNTGAVAAAPVQQPGVNPSDTKLIS